MPIPDEVIERVHELATGEGQKELIDGSPIFEWDVGTPIEDLSDFELEQQHMSDDNHVIESDDESKEMNDDQDEHDEITRVNNEDALNTTEERIDLMFRDAEEQLDRELAEIDTNDTNTILRSVSNDEDTINKEEPERIEATMHNEEKQNEDSNDDIDKDNNVTITHAVNDATNMEEIETS